MKKGLILIAMFVAFTMVAGVAMAEVQSIKVGGDIMMYGICRDNWAMRDYGDPSEPNLVQDNRENMMSTVRLRVDADLTDNVSAVVRLINERVWGEDEAASDTQIDLDLAYVTLKEFLYAPLTLVLGRQELHYGNDMIVGDPDTNQMENLGSVTIANRDLSARKSFDALKGILSYDPWTIDLIYAKVDENQVFESDDSSLYGLNVAYDFGTYNSMMEAYAWYYDREKATYDGGTFGNRTIKDDVLTFGTRGEIEPIENLVVMGEVAMQVGHYGGQWNSQGVTLGAIDTGITNIGGTWDEGGKRRAWACQMGAMYTLAEKKYTPKLEAWYTYYSGDEANRTGGTYTGWDPMFENQAGGTIYNDLFAASNCHILTPALTINPIEDVVVKGSVSMLWLDEDLGTTLYRRLTDQGNFMTSQTEGGENYLGTEVDCVVTYDYTEDVQFGLNSGIFIPGAVFGTANDDAATQIIGSMKVTF